MMRELITISAAKLVTSNAAMQAEDDVLCLIFAFLDARTIGACAQVCLQWAQVAKDQSVRNYFRMIVSSHRSSFGNFSRKETAQLNLLRVSIPSSHIW